MKSSNNLGAFRRTAVVFAASAVLSAAGVAHAQSVGVLTQDLKSEFEEHAQTIKQIDQYIKQVQQYEQMLTQVQNLGSNFQFAQNTRVHLDAGPIIQANCNVGSGGIAGTLLNSVTSLLNQSMAQSQQNICREIINTQVSKYNSTVDMLDTLDANKPALGVVTSATSGFSNLGESNSATTQATGYNSEMATRMNDWATEMKADDAIIDSLRDMQSTLARQAMNAKPGMVGQAVQAAALTTAFTYHPSL